MLMKPDPTAMNSSSALSVPTACGNCGVEERRLLHHVRHRGIFRRLCTTCVLRLHPQSFCPTCFQVYPPTPSNDAVLNCFKCYSSSHSHCAESGSTSSPSTPYICPLCLNPNAPIFKLKLAKEANVEIRDVRIEGCRVMDRDDAMKFLAAAKIASASMNKAAVAARAEAERRAKEAAFTRKRAKEALEHVAYLAMKEKSRKKEAVLAGPGDVSGPGLGGIDNNGGAPVKMERENDVNVSTSNGNGSVIVVEEKMNDSGNVDRDNSNHVLAALNAVELRENEKIGGGMTGVSLTDDDQALALMDVDEMGRTSLSAGETNNDCSDHVNSTDMEIGAANQITQGEKLEDVNNEVVLVQPMAQRAEDSNGIGGEQHTNGGLL